MAPAISKFSPGQSVQFTPEGYADASTRGAYTVTRVMPREPNGWYYHVQSVHDGHTRRVHEEQLRVMPGL